MLIFTPLMKIFKERLIDININHTGGRLPYTDCGRKHC